MINTNYKIEALNFLLNKDCLLERYFPLVQFKNKLLEKFPDKHKNDLYSLESELLSIFRESDYVILFKRFLCLYDVNKNKLKEISKMTLSEKEIDSYNELYLLPGVKFTRANLYYLSGYKNLKDISSSKPEEIIAKTADTISKYHLNYSVPKLKEVKTHIAVSKAFIL